MALPQCWVEGSMGPETDFSLQNIPFGIISTEANQTPRVGAAIGDFVCDMGQFSAWDVFDHVYFPCLRHVRNQAVFQSTTLNAFAALGRKVHGEVRETLRNIFTLGHPLSVSFRVESVGTVMLPLTSVTMHLPMQIGDYTDFYAGMVHATHVGTMFRGQENALQANYKHIPVGYHGRASSIVVSGTPVRRPLGQIIVDPSKGPETGPSRKLDFELELGCFICQPNEMGTPIPIQEAEDHIFGYVLLNDWSARDIQAWEYVPLGPFNGKNFATTISPWVVLHDALAPSMTTGEPNDTKLQPYLQEGRKNNVFDISLTAQLRTSDPRTFELTTTNARHLLWSFPQMIAHHTLGGCPLRTGDLLGSGTISSVAANGKGSGSLLELSENGKNIVELAGSVGVVSRTFLEDGDTVMLGGFARGAGKGRVGFGPCAGRIEGVLAPK